MVLVYLPTFGWVIFRVNVGKYTIHGAFGIWMCPKMAKKHHQVTILSGCCDEKNNNNFGRYHLCFRQTHIFISSICGGKTNSNRDLYRSEWGYNMMSCDNDVMFPHDMRCLNMSIKGIPIPPERSAIQDGHHARSPQQQWLSRRLLFFSFLAVDVGQYAVKTLLGVTFGSSPQGDDSVPR